MISLGVLKIPTCVKISFLEYLRQAVVVWKVRLWRKDGDSEVYEIYEGGNSGVGEVLAIK